MRSRKLYIGLAIVGVVIVVVATTVLVVGVKLAGWFAKGVSTSYEPATLYQKATEQIAKGDYAVAESYLEQALQKGDDSTYRTQLAVVKYRLGKYEQSIAEYKKLIAQGKDAAFAQNGIGNAYRDWALTDVAHKAEYQQQAIAAYEAASVADSKYVAAYSNLALLRNDRGEVDQAKEALTRGISLTSSPELAQLLAQFEVKK